VGRQSIRRPLVDADNGRCFEFADRYCQLASNGWIGTSAGDETIDCIEGSFAESQVDPSVVADEIEEELDVVDSAPVSQQEGHVAHPLEAGSDLCPGLGVITPFECRSRQRQFTPGDSPVLGDHRIGAVRHLFLHHETWAAPPALSESHASAAS